ncbi:cytochrome c3 family protein [Desulfopila sp. IMCC35006]|uniref:cytochrome c3 family protein n=1 Tax=Desulfopila sp. IMCC35006 TaxID=2569542 RepID=UPI001F1173FB|nr:cytochrome c3 family protein [Desulfopila sp. IMCC35006]
MVKNQRGIHYAGFALVILGTVLLSVSVMAGDKKKDVHPELSGQEMLIACADCHREATPEIEKEWYGSVHGIAMVKCYQCHGTYGDFMITPDRQTCATCHLDMLEKCPKDKPCWECHIPHSFKVKKKATS